MAIDQSLVMTFPNSQGDVEIYMPENTKVLIKCSGGADSSLFLYMLAKYRHECNPSITITIASSVNVDLPYQYVIAKRVAEYVNSVYPMGDYKHHHRDNRGGEFYPSDMNLLTDALDDITDKQYMLVTLNPPIEEMKAHNMYNDERCDFRDAGAPDLFSLKSGLISENNWDHNRPFARHDKRGIAEFYDNLGIRDTLFPLTRSCEEETTDFSSHCGTCWFCLEREWGFGELDPPIIVEEAA